MNIDSLIVAILDNTPQSREEKIKTISEKLVGQISELDQIEKARKIEEEKHLLEAFFKILQSISAQIQEVKGKYQNMDKEKMKQQKCIAIAKDIKIFKEECFYLRRKLTQAKKQLKNARIQNQLMMEEQEMLQKVYVRKSKEKDEMKMKTLSQFWTKSKHKSKGDDGIVPQRHTQFQFRTDQFDQPASQDKIGRLISTSQEPRRYGKSLDVNKSSSFKKMQNKKLMKFRMLAES